MFLLLGTEERKDASWGVHSAFTEGPGLTGRSPDPVRKGQHDFLPPHLPAVGEKSLSETTFPKGANWAMSDRYLPPLPEGFSYRLDLRHFVTPKGLKNRPIHRWFWFPHSFSPQLIDAILHKYPLPKNSRILDPFVGAGTTVLRALQLGYSAVGADLSPLSEFISKVKVSRYDKTKLKYYLKFILNYEPSNRISFSSNRIYKAFTHSELAHLNGLKQQIHKLPIKYAHFFLLALLRIQRKLSRAVPDGGWFRWVSKPDQSRFIASWFEFQANQQIDDVPNNPPDYPHVEIIRDDARRLDNLRGFFDMVLTSPPYPNRHDYTRIFHLELLSLGVDEDAIKLLRHTSFRSHVEAKAPDIQKSKYKMPKKLKEVIDALPNHADKRILPMLKGYFEDVYLILNAIYPRLNKGAFCVFVIGNVRHAGVMVPVDEILIQIGEQVGYVFEEAWVARIRGNSAQQMGRYGREPSRETIVFLKKT